MEVAGLVSATGTGPHGVRNTHLLAPVLHALLPLLQTVPQKRRLDGLHLVSHHPEGIQDGVSSILCTGEALCPPA